MHLDLIHKLMWERPLDRRVIKLLRVLRERIESLVVDDERQKADAG